MTLRLRGATAAVGMLLALAGGAGVALAQATPQRCDLVFTNTPETRINLVKQAPDPQGNERYNTFSGGGVVAHCVDQDVNLRADSAEYYGEIGTVLLIGNVHYTETRARVDSRRMTYYQNEQRLLAEGDVNAVLPSGTTMTGPRAEYYRAIPGVRPRTLLNATGRPHISIVQADSSGKPAEPVRVVATTVKMDGDSLVYASGQVEIDRVDISARGDSAFLDGTREVARLMRAPIVRGKGTRPFTLQGTVIDVYTHQRQLERVVAAPKAEAVSDSLRLTSDSIDLRVAANRLERAYAWGRTTRAHAVTPDRDILADSIEVWMPSQRIREVRAVRGAYAQSMPDTAKIRSGERDWLRGDTIVARFDTTNADTTRQPAPQRITASGHASSLYQIPSQRNDAARPAINYVRGRLITVNFANRVVSTVDVADRAAGIYLEAADSATASRAQRAAGRTGPPALPGGPPDPRAPATPAATPADSVKRTPVRQSPAATPARASPARP